MADTNNHINYSLADIERYLQGSMSSREMHDLERAALQDPFLADAIEGYSGADLSLSGRHLAEIETLLQKKEEHTAIVAMPRQPKKNDIWRVAASVILLAGIATASYFVFNKKSIETSLAKNEKAAMPAAGDSVHTTMQQAAPAPTDSAAFKYEQKDIAKNNAVPAETKKEKPVLPQAEPAHQKTPTPSFAQADRKDSADAGNGYAMAMRAPATTLSGNITDDKQNPVAGATIILSDSTTTISDSEGHFSVTTPDSTALASISAFSYKPVSGIRISRNSTANIQLKEEPVLAEVVVTSLGKARKKVADTTTATPEGGWHSFQEYVYKKLNKKYDSTVLTNASITGELQLEFSIDEKGRPYNFTVIHAPDSQVASDAISAIREGPKWRGTGKRKKTRVTLKY